MLKRKLDKVCLISICIFLMSATESNNGKTVITDSTEKIIHTKALANSSSIHLFDSAGRCSCLAAFPETSSADVPVIKLNTRVTRFAKEYIRTNKNGLDKLKANSSVSFDMMEKVFCDYELPSELKYLSVVESRLKHRAVSGKGAAGLWQLMPSTAKQMGLKITARYDERMQKKKSTQAAAKYLNSLYTEFNDWLLAIAAYNAGPGTIYKAIKKSGSRNFWKMQGCLPMETRDYVKRYISIHYYFEGHGSVTTLTQSELNAHIKAVSVYAEKKKAIEENNIELVNAVAEIAGTK